MTKRERYEYILDHFRENMGAVSSELDFGSTFQLLVAVMLSAQCTDKRVNMVTPPLFHDYPDAKAMASADENEIYEYVKSISYPNAKAHHLVEAAKILVSDYDGEVPEQMLLIDVPEAEYIVFEHGPFDYESQNGSVEEAMEAAMKNFDFSKTGYCLDLSPGRIFYFYHDPKRFWKYIRPVRKLT